MNRSSVLGCLLTVSCIGNAFASSGTLTSSFLKETSCFDELPPELQSEIAEWMLLKHPFSHLLFKELPNMHLQLQGQKGTIRRAVFNAAGNKILASDHESTKVWDVFTGACLHTFADRSNNLSWQQTLIRDEQFNNTEDQVVAGWSDKGARIFEVSGKRLHLLWGHEGSISHTQFNKAGDKVITTCENGEHRIWDTLSGKCIHTLPGNPYGAWKAQFNFSGDKVVSSANPSCKAYLWDVTSGRLLNILEGHTEPIGSAEFNRAGDMLVTRSSDNTARIWDSMQGTCLKILIGHTKIPWSVHFNSVGDKVVTASEDSTVKVWDTASGTCLLTFKDHTGPVKSAEFNATGDKIVTASDDHTSKIFEVATGKCLRTLYHNKPLEFAHFNSTGEIVATSSEDSTVKIWHLKKVGELRTFLEKEITHKQAFLLIAIYEAVICRALVKRNGWTSFVDDSQVVPPTRIRYDLNKNPSMKEVYDTLPQEIRNFVNPFVTDTVSPANSKKNNLK